MRENHEGADYASLIARLERATGADRELDAVAHIAMFPDQPIMTYGGSVGGPEGIRPAAYSTIGVVWPGGRGIEFDPIGLAVLIQAPRYTASLDAALALVGEKLPGAGYELFTQIAGKSYRAAVFNTGNVGADAEAPTMPLAVLIALLKALDAGKTGGGS